MGRVAAHLFQPRVLGPLGGVKWPIMIKFQLQSQFQRYYIPNFVFITIN